MGEISTVVLKADIKCKSCFRKMSQTLWELQAKQKIQKVEFNEDSVTITGRFDRKKVAQKLFGKISNCMLDIQIKGEDDAKNAKPECKEPAKPAKQDQPAARQDKPAAAEQAKSPKQDKLAVAQVKPAEPAEQAKDNANTKTSKPPETDEGKPKNAIIKPPEQTPPPPDQGKKKEQVLVETKSGDQPPKKPAAGNNAETSTRIDKEKGRDGSRTYQPPNLDCRCYNPTGFDMYHQCHCCGRGPYGSMWSQQHAMTYTPPVSQHRVAYPAPVYQQARAYPAPQYPSPCAYAGEPQNMCSIM